jgi:hypothetical protein
MEGDLELRKDTSSETLAQGLMSGMMDFGPSQLAELLNKHTTPVAGMPNFQVTAEMAAQMQAQFRPFAEQTSTEDRARRNANRAATLAPQPSEVASVIHDQD